MEAPYVCHGTKRQLVLGTDKNAVISTSSELVHKKRRRRRERRKRRRRSQV